MGTNSNYTRNVTSLTNAEIIGLVNKLVPVDGAAIETMQCQSKTKTIGVNKGELGELNYRKIELFNDSFEWSLVCKISLGFESSSEKIVTGFSFLDSDEDYYIEPINSSTCQKTFVKLLGINFDFSFFPVKTKTLYDYLNETLKMWGGDNNHANSYAINPQINSLGYLQCSVIEEIHFPPELTESIG